MKNDLYVSTTICAAAIDLAFNLLAWKYQITLKNRLGSLLRRVTVMPAFLQLLLRGLSFTHTSCLQYCDSNKGSINLRLEDMSPYPGKDTTRLSPIPRSLKQIIKRRMPWSGASPRRSGSHPVHEFIPLMERLNKLIKLSGCLVQHLIHRFQSLA